MTAFSLMVNGYYTGDFGEFRPYVGGGVGIADLELGTSSDSIFAYQLIAGVSYAFEDTGIEARIGYRLFGTADGDFDGTKTSLSTSDIEFGITLQF